MDRLCLPVWKIPSFQLYYKILDFPFREHKPEENKDLNCLTAWKSITDNVTAKVVFLEAAESFCQGSPGSLQYFWSTCSVIGSTLICVKNTVKCSRRAHGKKKVASLFVGTHEIKQNLDVLLCMGRSKV